MDLSKAIKTRKSVRYFSPKKADWRKILQAIDYARFAPAADNIFVNKFILVSDKKLIERIAGAAQQSFIEEASYVVVVTSNPSELVRRYKERGERWVAQQTGAAIENFLLALNERGLASGWIGHFSDNIVKDALGIPDEITVEAVFPVGKESRAKKSRISPPQDLENTVYFDAWGEYEMTAEPIVKQR
ncbi:hypothetical protein CMI41_04235 [Candidatus Pacearchaeota archaeon]|nr:hypothetical protein [Candidatus Pacearchaeota archaeon]|tara:strand:+ start:9220 stop:9783 length:564 start_codon:yes stop_codon:yes gene_type:complete